MNLTSPSSHIRTSSLTSCRSFIYAVFINPVKQRSIIQFKPRALPRAGHSSMQYSSIQSNNDPSFNLNLNSVCQLSIRPTILNISASRQSINHPSIHPYLQLVIQSIFNYEFDQPFFPYPYIEPYLVPVILAVVHQRSSRHCSVIGYPLDIHSSVHQAMQSGLMCIQPSTHLAIQPASYPSIQHIYSTYRTSVSIQNMQATYPSILSLIQPSIHPVFIFIIHTSSQPSFYPAITQTIHSLNQQQRLPS